MLKVHSPSVNAPGHGVLQYTNVCTFVIYGNLIRRFIILRMEFLPVPETAATTYTGGDTEDALGVTGGGELTQAQVQIYVRRHDEDEMGRAFTGKPSTRLYEYTRTRCFIVLLLSLICCPCISLHTS
jgi:hypothetical protein